MILHARGGALAAVAGLVAVAGALRWSETPGGGLAWNAALVLASAGYGFALLQRLGDRPSAGSATVAGLAVLLVASTLLARFGLLTRHVELGGVLVGAVLWLLPRERGPAPPPRAVLAFVVAAGLLTVLTRLALLSPWFADGTNHAMEVKRLWDTAHLGSLPHQLGAQIVGESYAAFATGAATAGSFDAGLCAALLIALLASELAARPGGFGLPMFVIIAVAIVFNPEPTSTDVARWSGTLFHLGAFLALQRALADRRTGWRVLPFALGLAAIRHELAILAFPYAAAGILISRPSARAYAIALAAWLGLLVAIRGGLGSLPAALALTAIAALTTAAALHIVGTYRSTSALATLVFATVATALAPALGILRSGAHSASAIGPTWFAAALALLLLVDDHLHKPREPRLRPLAAVIITAAVVAMTSLWTTVDTNRIRYRARDRFLDALLDLERERTHGYILPEEDAARALQSQVPPGAPIGFWGRWPGSLDYKRNPIRDLTFTNGRYLARPSLAGVEYVIAETLKEPPRGVLADPWGEPLAPPPLPVDDQLTPVAAADTTQLFRVK